MKSINELKAEDINNNKLKIEKDELYFPNVSYQSITIPKLRKNKNYSFYIYYKQND